MDEDIKALVADLREAYGLVAEWPEKSPDGLMKLLALRNMVPDTAEALERLMQENEALRRGRDEWRSDFRALEAAVVGDTGLSAITVAAQARKYRPRAEAAEARVAELEAQLAKMNWERPTLPQIAELEAGRKVGVKALDRLHTALRNFTNGAMDPYEARPDLWEKETEENFAELCDAYGKAYIAGVFPSDETLETAEKREHAIARRALERALDCVHETDSLEMAQYGEAKIMARISALADDPEEMRKIVEGE